MAGNGYLKEGMIAVTDNLIIKLSNMAAGNQEECKGLPGKRSLEFTKPDNRDGVTPNSKN